jgi:hypothetical protein
VKRIVQGSSWQLSHCFDVEFWKVVDFSNNNSNREQSWLPTLPPSLPLPSSPSLPRCELHSHLVPNTVCGVAQSLVATERVVVHMNLISRQSLLQCFRGVCGCVQLNFLVSLRNWSCTTLWWLSNASLAGVGHVFL